MAPSWAHLGLHGSNRRKVRIKAPPIGDREIASWAPHGTLLSASWALLGPSLGPSLTPIGALLGNIWGNLEASESHRKRKGENAQHYGFLKVFGRFWLLGDVLGGLGEHLKPSWGRLRASWMHVGGYLAPSRAILSDLGGRLAAYWDLLEPSWAEKDPLTHRGAPRPDPGEGVG